MLQGKRKKRENGNIKGKGDENREKNLRGRD